MKEDLVHKKCAKALSGEGAWFTDMSDSEKAEENNLQLLIMHLYDIAFRKVNDTV